MAKELLEEIEVIPAGKVKCFITGKLRKDTAEERIRQDMARILVEEYKYSKLDIDIEFSIRMGTTTKRADIVVFLKDEAHSQENIYIIVEAKPEDIKPSNENNGVDQLKTYVSASPNSKFALWVGNERLAYEVLEKIGKRIFSQIPDIPKEGETTVPKPSRDSLVPAVNLKRVFKRIHNYIYANQGIQKDKAFEELLKLIFTKVFDERFNEKLQFYILSDESGAEARLRIEKVFRDVQQRYKYIFKGNEEIELKDTVLKYVISELQKFSLVNTDTDVKGEAYEEIVGPNLRGDRGEFFTPRNVYRMTIEMLFSLFSDKKLTTPGAIKILDPAVGTGGFLIVGIQEIKQLFQKRKIHEDLLRELVHDVTNSNFFGIDFNPFLTKVSQMNMVMHGDGSSNMLNENSLEDPKNWNEIVKDKIHFGEFDIVVTNPPFGTKTPIDSPTILDQYELRSYGAKKPSNSLPPEQLYIERCLNFLKPGGYMGIVLPDSILSNPGLDWIREWIIKKAYLIASIDLPVETFEPHTGTQTSILILKKKKLGQEKLTEDYDVFMAIPEKVGHDRRGNTLFKTTPDGEIEVTVDGQPFIDDDLPLVSKTFKEWIKTKGMV